MVIDRALCPVLIGREEELGTLEDALLAAGRRDGQVVLLGGEAGLGKTRMATELQRRATALGCSVLVGGCSESELALPYLPLLEAIGNYLATADITGLRERLGPAAGDLGQLFPQFGAERSPAADSPQAKVRLYESIFALLRALSEDHTVLFTIEDLHWADASTREVLDYLTRRVRGSRMMLLGTYRRDELHRKHPFLPLLQSLRRSGVAQIVELEPLPSEQVAEMIGAIFDMDQVGMDFRDLLYERTEGNPFVLEEMLKEAIDRGDIYRTSAGWANRELADLRIPQSVADSILLRVERLQPDQADVLRAAAVLGVAFDYATLLPLTDLEEPIVKEALRECIAQQLIVEDPATPSRYRFRHALTRESIYEDIIQPERRALHARAAEVLAADPDVPAAELARHLLAAGRLPEAAPYCLKAAAEALRRYAYDEAIDLYELALPAITDEPERGRILCEIGKTYWRNNRIGAERYLEDGIPLLEKHGADLEAARWRIVLGRAYWERGDPVRARADYELALPILEAAGPSEDLALVTIRLAGLAAFDLDSADARRLAAQAKEIAAAIGSDSARLLAEVFEGIGLMWQGRIDEGLDVIDRSEESAARLGLDWVSSNASANAVILRIPVLRASEVPGLLKRYFARPWGMIYMNLMELFEGAADYQLGDVSSAIVKLTQAHEEARNQNSFMESWARGWLAQAHAERLEMDRALALIPSLSEVRHREELLWFASEAIRVFRAGGDVARAEQIARSVCDNARYINGFRALVPESAAAFIEAGDVSAAAWFVDATGDEPDRERPYMELARGRVALARGELENARDHFRDAAEGFAAAGYVHDEQRARVDLGVALGRAGDTAGASVELRWVLSSARLSGSRLQEREARAAAEALGLVLGEPEPEEVSAETAGDARELRDATERLVTVMFADVRGYTALTASSAPAQIADRVGSFHRWAQREVERRHGLVDKFAGDAVMATFNVSGRSLDHCLHALQAAVALQDKAAAADLPVGVGIAVGPAIVGRLTEGANVSVLGEATNLAARLQAEAGPGEILLSEEAYRRVRSWLESIGTACDMVSLTLKGFDGPVPAYVVRLRSRT